MRGNQDGRDRPWRIMSENAESSETELHPKTQVRQPVGGSAVPQSRVKFHLKTHEWQAGRQRPSLED